MNNLVNLKTRKAQKDGKKREIQLPFEQAKLLLKDMLKPFELADKGYKIVNNELIKQPSSSNTGKSKESK